MDLERKYTPGVPSRYRWNDATLETRLTPHLTRLTTRPVLMYGPPGSGKSRLGRLLPHMICSDLDPSMNMKEIHGTGTTGSDIDDLLDFCKISAWNSMHMHVITIEEVDDVPVSVMNALKGFLDAIMEMPDPTLVVMTTNHIAKISGAVRDRCELIHVALPRPSELLDFAKHILASEGMSIDEGLLLGILEFNAENGLSYREFYKRLTRLVAKKGTLTP